MAQKLYDWGDGKGKVHSRPKRTGTQLGAAKERKRLADPTYFTRPLTLGQAQVDAQRAGDLRYGGVEGQLGLQARQIPAWFADYQKTLLTPPQVQAQYQPAIQQQQTAAQQSGQTLGLTGEAAGQDQLAAKAREALANLGTATLQSAQQADTSYYQGRQGVAQAAQIGAQTQNQQASTDVARERGAYQGQYVADAREAERNYGLAAQHQLVENKAFGLDVAKAQGVDPVTGKKLPPTDKKDVITSGPFAGYTKGQVRGMDPAKKDRLRRRAAQGKPGEPKYGVNAAEWARMSPAQRKATKDAWESGGGGGSKTYTNEQHTNAKRDLRKAVGKVQDKLAGKKTAPDTFWKQAYSALVNELDMDPAVARAAVQLVRGGKVGPNTRGTLLSDYGIKPTDYPKGTKRKKPPAYKIPGRPGTAPSGTGDGQGNDSRRPTAYNPDTDQGRQYVDPRAEQRAYQRALRKRWWETHMQGPSRRQIS